MDRTKLLGLAASLNVVQAELDAAGSEFREASRQINSAVVNAGASAEMGNRLPSAMLQLLAWQPLLHTIPACSR